MTIRRRIPPGMGKSPLQLTPLVDIVFLLLVFFLLTFKITPPEGDFNVSVPASSQAGNTTKDTVPAILRLRADDHGNLASIQLGKRQFARDFTALRHHIRLLRTDTDGTLSDSFPAITLDCDYHLRYEYVVEAIDAISGFRNGGRIVPLVQNVRFAHPRPG
jgi:biopolymer transport protein ExbD